jgi:transposase InsO family protein
LIKASDRVTAVALIEEAVVSGAREWKACETLGISVRTLQRWIEGRSEVKRDGRKGAVHPKAANKLSEAERLEVLRLANTEEYRSMPPAQIVPDLADKGVYIASEATFYRVLRDAEQQRHRGRSKVPQKRTVSGYYASRANQVWSWDITWLPGAVKGFFYYLYLIVDIFSRKIVGWEVYETESAECASELVLRAALSERLGGAPLVLHSDNGSPMKGSSLLATLNNLGIEASYSRPRVSNDNPYSESLFHTLKYRPAFPYQGFTNIVKSRGWVNRFVIWYNEEHHHSGLNFVTPSQRHQGLDAQIMAQRKEVYEAAKAAHPERWSRDIRKMDLPEGAWLNPPSKVDIRIRKNL